MDIILIPIIGWFAVGGYSIRIIKSWIKGDFNELPEFNFGEDMKLGFFMFLKSIPFIIVYMIVQFILGYLKTTGMIVNFFIALFVVPILVINFFNKETVTSYFEFEKVKPVFQNIGDYVLVLLKSIALQIIFLVLIVVLVGIPAGAFTKNIFLADFYRRTVEQVEA